MDPARSGTGSLHYVTVENELKRFSGVVEKHVQDLETIKETLEPYALPPWQPVEDMISYKLEPLEFVSDFDIIRTDNQLLNKTVLVLSSLCKEMTNLADESENDFYVPLLIYGNHVDTTRPMTEYPHISFSKILPIMNHISSYIEHVKRVVWNVFLQLNVLHSNEKKPSSIHAGSAHFQVVFEHLGRVLGTLIAIDDIVSNNATLQDHFIQYKRILKSGEADPASFSTTRKELENLKKFLHDIEIHVMSASILKNVLSELRQNNNSNFKNSCLRDEMLTVILGWSSQVEDSSSEGWHNECKDHVLAITALAIFYQVIFDTQEKKIAKELIVLYKKVPCVRVAVNHVWMGEKYISTHFPSLHSAFERKSLDALNTFRKQYLSNKTHSIAAEVQTSRLKVLGWCSQMEAATKRPASLMTKQDLDRRVILLWQGLLFASSLKYSAESIIGLHSSTGQPLNKSWIISFCQMLELLKAIQYTYYHNTSMLAETLPHLRQFLSYQLLTLLKKTKERARDERKLNEHILDVLSALTLAEEALAGNADLNRLLIARIALSLANQDKIISEEDLSLLLILLRRLSVASDIQGRIRRCTNVDFIFQHQIVFKIYLQEFMENCNSSCVHKIHYMLAAVADSDALLRTPKELPDRELLLKSLHEETEELVKEEFLDKLCKAVENELRLTSHSHLQLEKESPFDKPLKQIYPFVHLQPLQLFGTFFHVKEYIEQYLERTFYNMTVLAPHDCSTYELMMTIARSRLGLVTVDSHLPSHNLDQGVDVLEIMRNINIFVQNYQYNLNQQFFVEIENNNKYLNTVSIKHIANSIRTHGTGIINTTVNFTYQFLRKKFHVFSQFLYDEHIKSRLLKDFQYWKEVKESEKSFPFERANKFHKGIRKLGLTADGLSYLDQFRKLVTHIGNAIGYIRLVRSGCLHCISTATQFIPDLEDVVSFKDLLQEDIVHKQTMEAAKNLDDVISNLTAHFHKDTDYFKIMVDVFSSVLRDEKNSHLRNFFLIVPALTINFIEYFIGAKENLYKKNRTGATFTDDGFAVGVAYILAVLDQKDAFDTIYWWSGVRRKFIKEKEKVEIECGKAKEGDTKLQQTLSLTLRRLQEQQRAFEVLFLGVRSSQVFFRSTLEDLQLISS